LHVAGYGFLSENAAFAKALEEAGIVFIGPGQDAMAAMGDKIESKIIANKAGVNTIPGYDGAIKGVDHALEIGN
jgi:propionyl-CoA carboxylase alpha chain